MTDGIAIVMISFILLSLWSVIYISAIYEYENVYLGFGPSSMMINTTGAGPRFIPSGNYEAIEKGPYVMSLILWCIVVLSFYSYFYVVCDSYRKIYQYQH